MRFPPLFLLTVWVIISISGTFYNLRKTIIEEPSWLRLSNEDKKRRIFGELYNFLKIVAKKTSLNSSILFISSDGRIRYLGIYYLYPRHQDFVQNYKDFRNLINSKKYQYVVIFEFKDKNLQKMGNKYKLVERFEEGRSYGSIYKVYE